MKEIWKPIPGFSRYEVSSFGRVKTYLKSRRGKLVHQVRVGRGYKVVGIMSDSNVRERAFVHRLVMLAFVGERPNDMFVCHWDDDPGNNRLENLRYGTAADNGSDRRRIRAEQECRDKEKLIATKKILRQAVMKFYRDEIDILKLCEFFDEHAKYLNS